jgi:hypothetical protein
MPKETSLLREPQVRKTTIDCYGHGGMSAMTLAGNTEILIPASTFNHAQTRTFMSYTEVVNHLPNNLIARGLTSQRLRTVGLGPLLGWEKSRPSKRASHMIGRGRLLREVCENDLRQPALCSAHSAGKRLGLQHVENTFITGSGCGLLRGEQVSQNAHLRVRNGSRLVCDDP